MSSRMAPAAMAAWVLAVGVAASSALAASSSPSGPLLAKITDAYGGRTALDSIKSIRVQMSLTSLGQPSTVTYTQVYPDRFLQVIAIPALHVTVTTAVNGAAGWQQDSYGHVQALSGDKLASAECQAHDPMSTLLHPATGKGLFAMQPDATVDGKKYHVLLLSQPGCPSTTIYVDPKTYLVTRLTDDVATTDFSDFTTGPAGEKYPKTLSVTTAGVNALATITQKEDNVAVDDTIFAMPAASPAPAPSSSPQ